MTTLSDLTKVAKSLTKEQLELLYKMAKSLQSNITRSIAPGTDIVTDRFEKEFSNILLIHHATHKENLKKKAFEFAFDAASQAENKKTEITNNPTLPGADVIVDGTSFSLKTEGSINLNPDYIHISKLMEARWIRDCKNINDYVRETTQRVFQHLSQYQRILILRSANDNDTVRYDLIEIPVELLKQVTTLKRKDFKPITKVGSTSAKVKKDGVDTFTLTLDGSVEKITIQNLSVKSCIHHATWVIPTVS
jgi:hypothetical protein